MIRRKRRRAHASSSQDLAFAKGHRDPKAERRTLKRDAIAVTRPYVWRRSKGLCEICGNSEGETRKAGAAKWEHELHEAWISRAEGRGLDPALVFNAWNCLRACPPCHHALTVNQLYLHPGSWVDGCEGGFVVKLHKEFWPTLDGRIEMSRLWVEAQRPTT